ncbi:hypothetical protein DMN91_009973 [Ooceraea biroi]|nr:hypothetical protein DMN91_009973 [Ooceraea biroi]
MSGKMVVDEPKPKVPPKKFTVENNVYKGEVVPLSSDYKGLGELIWKSINKYKNNIAHVDAQTDKVVTYAELQNKVVRCALWLQEHGIKSGDVISICSKNHLDSIVPCLAATYINAIFNPWNEDMNLHTAYDVLEQTMPKVIFCTKKPVDIILTAIKDKNCSPIVVVYGDHPGTTPFFDVLSGYSDAQVANFRYLELDDIKKTACILHTSGTTGMPKGAELSNYSLLISVQDGNKADEIALWFSSLYWITGVVMNIQSIMNGVKVIIYPHFDEEMTCQLIEKYKVEWLFLGTSMVNRFLKAGFAAKYPLSSLKVILSGGAILKAKAQEELKRVLPQVQVLQSYGMTEAGGLITRQFSRHKMGSCGTVIPNHEIKIVDLDNGETLGPNQTGGICIKSANVMTGYYRNPEATKEMFDAEGWLHSGDIGYIDADGELYVSDRLKYIMKYREYQISPAEIEILLHTHPGVLEVAVMGVPHPIDDEHPVAFVTIKPGFTVTEKELVDLVANNMTDIFKLRAGVVFLDAFPYTGTGKIAKVELKAMAKKLAVEEADD